MIPGVHCSTCVFFSPPPFTSRGDRLFGQCRRHAPLIDAGGDRPRTIWPIVSEDAWCGEHSHLSED